MAGVAIANSLIQTSSIPKPSSPVSVFPSCFLSPHPRSHLVLPQAHRLRHWRDFQVVYQKGIRRSGMYLHLRAIHHSPSQPGERSPTRIGISISRKVSKKAVVRNRIKRQIRAVLCQLLPDLAPGWDCIIIVKPGSDPCNSSQFLQELKQLLAKAEVLHGHSRGNIL